MSTQEESRVPTQEENAPSPITGNLILNRDTRRYLRKCCKRKKTSNPEDGIIPLILIPAGEEKETCTFLIPLGWDDRSDTWHVRFNSGLMMNRVSSKTLFKWIEEIKDLTGLEMPDLVVVFLKSSDGSVVCVDSYSRIVPDPQGEDAELARLAVLLGCDVEHLLPKNEFTTILLETIVEAGLTEVQEDFQDGQHFGVTEVGEA